MLKEISEIFFIIMKVFAVYFSFISLFAFLRTKCTADTDRRLKFAVLIPARNEENCIGGIVESILAQNYPQEMMDVFVIPNNCTDDTSGEAVRAGATIIGVSSKVNSKGKALHEAIEKLLLSEEEYDAFCVFDADNEADENFLLYMNRTLCSGARVAKSSIFSKNRGQSWVCACYDIYFCFANLFLNRARETLGLSARLVGTGFALRRDFLEEIGGFNTDTITEDAEFFAICAAKGERIFFCEEAVTYDEEPLSFRTSLVQRKRWMSGVLQVTQFKMRELCKGLNRVSSTRFCFDTLMQFVFAYLQGLMPIVLILAAIADPLGMLLSLPASIISGYLGSALAALIALAMQKRLDREMILGILMYPFFVLSFIPLQTLSLFKRTTDWQEIRHTGVRYGVTGLRNNRKLPGSAA